MRDRSVVLLEVWGRVVRLALFEQDPRSFSSGKLLPMFLLNDIYNTESQ
jgi:hypothetical protein